MGRLYETPQGNRYPSVTTVIGKMSDKSWLDEWRNRVGHEEADRVTKLAGDRGTLVHDLCERYVQNIPINTRKEFPLPLSMFRQIKKYLDENLGKIYCLESQLYSDRMKIAGTVDLIAEWKGSTAVIDYKTANTKKTSIDDILGYCIQCTLYACMVYELTRIKPKLCVVLIANQNELEPSIFEFSPFDYLEKSLKMVEDFHLQF